MAIAARRQRTVCSSAAEIQERGRPVVGRRGTRVGRAWHIHTGTAQPHQPGAETVRRADQRAISATADCGKWGKRGRPWSGESDGLLTAWHPEPRERHGDVRISRVLEQHARPDGRRPLVQRAPGSGDLRAGQGRRTRHQRHLKSQLNTGTVCKLLPGPPQFLWDDGGRDDSIPLGGGCVSGR